MSDTTPDMQNFPAALGDLIRRHAAVSAELTRCRSFREIATALARHLLFESGQYITINLFERDEAGELSGLRTIISANRSTVFDGDDVVYTPLTLAEAGAAFNTLITEAQTVIIEDIPTYVDTHPVFKPLMSKSPTQTALMMPMLDEDGVLGYVSLNSRDSFSVSAIERDVYHTLAQNIGILLHANNLIANAADHRRLLDDAQRNLDEAQVLYEVNRALFSAGGSLDILRLIKQHIAPDALTMSLVVIEWDYKTDDVISVMRTATINQSGEIATPIELLDNTKQDQIEKFKAEWALQGSDVELIGDLESLRDERPAVEFSLQRGFRSQVVIPVVDDGYLMQQIFIAYDRVQHFDERQQRMFAAIRDQIALVLHNQRLLQRTEESLAETRNLYALNRDLLTAQGGLDVLRALKSYLAPNATSLSSLNIEWNTVTHALEAVVLQDIIGPQGESSPQRNLLDPTDTERVEAYKAEWALQGEDIDFIEDTGALLEERPAVKPSYEAGILASVVIPVYDDELIVQQIFIAFDEPQVFSPQQRRLYEAIRTQLMVVVQNERLLRDTQIATARLGNQVRILQTLNHLAGVLPAAANENELGEMTTEALMSALNVGHASMTLLNRERENGVIVGECPEMLGVGAHIPQDSLIFNELHERRQTLIVTSVATDPRLQPDLREQVQKLDIRAFYLLPMVDSRGTHIGTITLDLMESHPDLSETNLEIAQTITGQASVFLQNLLLLRNTQRQAEQLQHVADFGKAIQMTFNMEELLSIALQDINKLVDAEFICIMMFDTQHGILRQSATRYYDKQTVKLNDGAEIPIENTTVGRVWQTQQALNVHDLRTFGTLKHPVRNDIRSTVVIPIYLRGTVQGVADVSSVKTDNFSATDVIVVQQLVSQFGVALENADAYNQNQRLARSKAQVNEISNVLQRQTDIDALMSITMKELGKALGAKRGRIRLGKPTDDTQTTENGTG